MIVRLLTMTDGYVGGIALPSFQVDQLLIVVVVVRFSNSSEGEVYIKLLVANYRVLRVLS